VQSSPRSATISIPQLRADLNGSVSAPDDAGYDEARTIFPGGIDRRPAVIVRPANATDVAHVVSLARDSGQELAVRSGGHSIFAVSEGGIVLDLSDMKELEIDVEGRTAWAETGLTAGEYSSAVGAHGLATGFGDTASVGIGGITLGGGVGYLVRKYGLTIDDVLAAEIVTADGELLRVDAEAHPDLFWAIRGGGGNFGVVTRFKFRLHVVDQFVGGFLFLPATHDVIHSFMAEAESAPEELSAIANIMPAPPMPFLPEEYHGKLVVMAIMAYAGDTEAGERAIAPFRALASPIADMVRPMTYPEIYPPEEEGYHPMAAVRTMFVEAIDHEAVDTIIERLQSSTAFMRVAQLRVLGGAMARVPNDATAFAHRGRRIMVNVAALYERPEEAEVYQQWIAGFAAELNKGDASGYVNFLNDEGEERIRAAYPGSTWDRLTAVKRRYDPTNLFRLNQNVPPASEGTGM
jgi:FAD/FMN-containing dehydrogenase